MLLETPPHRFKLGQAVYFCKAQMPMHVTSLILPQKNIDDDRIVPYYGLTNCIHYHIDGTVKRFGDHVEYLPETLLLSLDEAKDVIELEYDDKVKTILAELEAEKKKLLDKLSE
jgi:hypothetical protein